ncbi:MAG: hypothetical protein JF603_05745 [Acidobacteria bacterium]|nr:hypothetical protein [Acidobacteriota bacterium]
MPRRRHGRAAVAFIAIAGALCWQSPAGATWTTMSSGSARGRASVIAQVAKPLPVRDTGNRVTVNWSALASPGVSYQVLRDNGTAIGSGTCSVVVAGTSCTDTAAHGTHTYTVTATLQQWRGPTSPASDQI